MENDGEELLTADDLRKRLFHVLKNRGVVDMLKTQLRNNLITELQHYAGGQLTERPRNLPEEGSVLHKAANSLVADHLQRCNYEYTFSIFLPESHMSADKIFSTPDLLQLLHISSQSTLYKQLTANNSKNANKGFLWQMLSELIAAHANPMQNVGVQTDLIRVQPISSLDEKLNGVDKFYLTKKEEHMRNGMAGFEDKILSVQRQLEQQYRTELKLEAARMRENEFAHFKVEEKEKCRQELEQARNELERTYQLKCGSLLERERNLTERFQKEQEIWEETHVVTAREEEQKRYHTNEIQSRQVYAQRQSLLDEIDVLRQREAEVTRISEANARERKLQDDRLLAQTSSLREREAVLKRQEAEYQQTLHNQISKFKIEQQTKFLERVQNLDEREARIKVIESKITEDNKQLQSMKEELRDKTARISELETLLQEARHKELSASKTNEFLNAKLRDMIDYTTIKEDNAVLRRELETVKTRLAEVLQVNERERARQEEMLSSLQRPNPEILLMQRDMERAKESLRQEQTLSEHQKQQMEARLKEELDRNGKLLKQYRLQTQQMSEMNQEISDLKKNLCLTKRALDNEVYKTTRLADVRSNSILSQSAALHLDGRTSSHRSFPLQTSVCGHDNYSCKNELSYSDDSGDVVHSRCRKQPTVRNLDGEFSDEEMTSTDSAHIIANTKYRLKVLEKEAKNLEKAYQDFQLKVVSINSEDVFVTTDRSRKKMVHKIGFSGYDHSLKPRNSLCEREKAMSSTPHRKFRILRDTEKLNDDDDYGLFAQQLNTHSGDNVFTPLPKFDLSELIGEGGERIKDLRSGEEPEDYSLMAVGNEHTQHLLGEMHQETIPGILSNKIADRPFSSEDTSEQTQFLVMDGKAVKSEFGEVRPTESPKSDLAAAAVMSPLLPPTSRDQKEPCETSAGKVPLILDSPWKNTEVSSLDDAWRQQWDDSRKSDAVEKERGVEAKLMSSSAVVKLKETDDQKTECQKLSINGEQGSSDNRWAKREETSNAETEQPERIEQEVDKVADHDMLRDADDEASQASETDNGAKIDPVMKKYMEQVKQQKLANTKETGPQTDSFSKDRSQHKADGFSHSEDMSIPEDIMSGDDDPFKGW